MLNIDEKLTQEFSGKKLLPKVLRGRGFLWQSKKKTHKGIPVGTNIWVRDLICTGNCQEAHLLIALCLDPTFHINSVYSGVRYIFEGKSYEDMDTKYFPKEILNDLLAEIQKTVAGIYVPRGYDPVGKPLPRMLREADWHPVGSGKEQWRCNIRKYTWNSNPPTKKRDPSSIIVNNSFFTTFPSNEHADLNIVLSLTTDENGNVCYFEVNRYAVTGFCSSCEIESTKNDDFVAKQLLIDLEYEY